MSLRVLLVRMGLPAPALLLEAGDYPAWFADALPGRDVALHPVAPFSGEALPDAGDFDAILTTGSPLSVTRYDDEPWMQRTGAFLVDAAERGKPVLGVCFGHQLLARALGGRVEKNPRGREIGTIDLAASGAFGERFDLRGTPRFHCTHEDAVTALPGGSTLLAENGFGIQAFAHGPRILAVQFHPELDARRMLALIESRAAILSAEGILERARASVRETDAGRRLLAAWLAGVQPGR